MSDLEPKPVIYDDLDESEKLEYNVEYSIWELGGSDLTAHKAKILLGAKCIELLLTVLVVSFWHKKYSVIENVFLILLKLVSILGAALVCWKKGSKSSWQIFGLLLIAEITVTLFISFKKMAKRRTPNALMATGSFLFLFAYLLVSYFGRN